MKCPKCSAAMESVSYQGIEVDRCTKCAGLWFDMLEAEDLKKLSGSESIDIGSAKTGKAQDRKDKVPEVCSFNVENRRDRTATHLV